MKITNKQNLPDAFLKMAQSNWVAEENTFRVTSLIKGSCEAILEKRHHDEIEVDVADMIWLLFGTAAHHILESQQEQAHEIKEARVSMVIDGIKISGQFDLYDSRTRTVKDYKTCSVWKVIHGDYSDWKRQLSIYGYLLEHSGFPVKDLEIVAIMKDHSKAKAKFNNSYPQHPVKRIRMTYNRLETNAYIHARVTELNALKSKPDAELPPCSPEQRYNTGDKFAIMGKGKKRALRVLDNREDAEVLLKQKGDYIEVRKGEDKKCHEYCNVNQWCEYYKKNYGGKK